MPDLDPLTANGPRRVFSLLHEGRPILLNFGEPDGFDITAWAERALGVVPAPTAVLIRPDGYVAWAGDSMGSS